MATPLIRVMNGHIYKVPNRRKCKPELKPSEIPTLLGYTASLVDKKWLRLAARRIATIACSACHDEIDRRTHFVDAGYAKECALEGMARTQVIWLKEGVIEA